LHKIEKVGFYCKIEGYFTPTNAVALRLNSIIINVNEIYIAKGKGKYKLYILKYCKCKEREREKKFILVSHK